MPNFPGCTIIGSLEKHMPTSSGVVVAAHQIGPLVDVEADAVAGAVRQAGQLVVRARSRSRPGTLRAAPVDRLARRAEPGGVERAAAWASFSMRQ